MACHAERQRQPDRSPPEPEGLTPALARNIEALTRSRRESERREGLQVRLAHAITRFTGSMVFVYVHLAILVGWIVLNVSLVPGVKPFDPSFVFLATAASVEAIFLSTFVLISQNRAAETADRRADLDLQINLLAEHEITHLMTLVVAIAKKLEIPEANHPELSELRRDVAPETVLATIDSHNAVG